MESWNKLMEERGTRTDMPMKPQVVTHELNKLLDQRRHRLGRQRHDCDLGRALYRDARRHAVLPFRHRWPRWRTDCRTASARRSHIQDARLCALLATADSRCSWASSPR